MLHRKNRFRRAAADRALKGAGQVVKTGWFVSERKRGEQAEAEEGSDFFHEGSRGLCRRGAGKFSMALSIPEWLERFGAVGKKLWKVSVNQAIGNENVLPGCLSRDDGKGASRVIEWEIFKGCPRDTAELAPSPLSLRGWPGWAIF
ncbi:hypothetical protein [Chromobacterium violaceum]